jgi:hypothetical protein
VSVFFSSVGVDGDGEARVVLDSQIKSLEAITKDRRDNKCLSIRTVVTRNIKRRAGGMAQVVKCLPRNIKR